MTIAAGFLCNEGIVLSADSQETIPGCSKDLSHGKIIVGISRTSETSKKYESLLSYAFVGAGDTDYIATAFELVQESFHGCHKFVDIQPSLDKSLRRFYKERIAPWGTYPINERPYIELLIGVSFCSTFGLFHSSGTALHRCDRPKAIGTGAILANTLMTQFYDFNDGIDELIKLATFVVHKVKAHVDGCGGFTHVSALRRGGDFGLVEGVEGFEKEIDKAEKKCTEEFRAHLFSSIASPKVTWLLDSKSKKDLLGP